MGWDIEWKQSGLRWVWSEGACSWFLRDDHRQLYLGQIIKYTGGFHESQIWYMERFDPEEHLNGTLRDCARALVDAVKGGKDG
jgi:hypothetical protein